jgi:hypothetical protein
MRKSAKNTVVNFQVTQSHNLHDCEVGISDAGRHQIKRRVDRRIGVVVELLVKSPTGYATISEITEAFNRKFIGSVYTDNDVRYAVQRAVALGLVTHREGGAWRASPRAKEAWKSIVKNLRATK